MELACQGTHFVMKRMDKLVDMLRFSFSGFVENLFEVNFIKSMFIQNFCNLLLFVALFFKIHDRKIPPRFIAFRDHACNSRADSCKFALACFSFFQRANVMFKILRFAQKIFGQVQVLHNRDELDLFACFPNLLALFFFNRCVVNFNAVEFLFIMISLNIKCREQCPQFDDCRSKLFSFLQRSSPVNVLLFSLFRSLLPVAFFIGVNVVDTQFIEFTDNIFFSGLGCNHHHMRHFFSANHGFSTASLKRLRTKAAALGMCFLLVFSSMAIWESPSSRMRCFFFSMASCCSCKKASCSSSTFFCCSEIKPNASCFAFSMICCFFFSACLIKASAFFSVSRTC